MSTKLSDYDYALPERLIAKYPVEKRDDSRLLVVNRASQSFTDRRFTDILEYLHEGDCLVLNQTQVIPARLFGTREKTGARMQVFLHQRTGTTSEDWRVLLKPAKKAPIGERIVFDGLACEVIEEIGNGEKLVRFDRWGTEFFEAIDRIGKIPLPPYIDRDVEASDSERYQTVFAKHPGAVAAPTAGLHFTSELLSQIEAKGVKIAFVTLHTGLGTFRPVEHEDITRHTMHEESYEISPDTANAINEAKSKGGRIVAVGTTTVRTLETMANDNGTVKADTGMSGIFIYPPYKFKVPDAMLTNFHMPRSTLLMMISAFAGREFILSAYLHAVQSDYRFFSYGDAMLIL